MTKQQRGHDVAVHELVFDKAGKLLASAGGDRTVRLWNGSSGDPLRTLPASSMVYAVAVRPDGQQVAGGCFDGTVLIWETATGRPLVSLVSGGGADAIDWLALTPEGFAAGSDSFVASGQWRSAAQLPPAESLWPVLRRPEQVAKAWHGDKIAEPSLPPTKPNGK